MTDYLRLAQQRIPAEPEGGSNPYLEIARGQQSADHERARTVLETALRDDPDIAAERLRISKMSGVPLRVVERNLDELRIKERARMVDLASMAQDSPILYRQLTDPTFTTTAVDDIGTLKEIERSIGKGVRYVMGASEGGGLPSDLVGAGKSIALGATVGVGKMVFDLAGVVADIIPGGDNAAATYRGMSRRAQGAIDEFGFQGGGPTRDAVKSGLQSAGQNLALLPLGLARGLYATANQAAAAVAGAMSVGVGADAFNRARDKGRNEAQALTYAIPEAAFEFVFERIPAAKLFQDIALNAGLLKTIGAQMVTEGWTEQVTTLAQDFNEWMNLNPSKTLAEFIQERPEAAYQTFIATLVGVGVQTTAIQGINKVVEKASNQALGFEMDLLEKQLKLAGQSALRQRSPEQFRTLVQTVVDENDGAKKELYVDAEVLNQLPPELLEQLPEAVREQIDGALQTGSTVAIPMADVLTLAPGTPLEQVLNDNARMSPDSPSRADAAQAEELLRTQAEEVLRQAQDQQAWADSAEVVKTTLLDQLNAVGRFGPDVNEAYSILVRDFYSVMAGRTGLTPEQFYAKYPLRVAGVQPAGPMLDQVTPEQAMATNVPVEMPTAPEFAEAVGNTPGAQVTENGLLLDLVRFQKPEQEGAQAIRTGVFYLPAGSKQVTGYRGENKLYGGTEKFQGTTLLRRPFFVKGATGGKAPEAAYDAIRGKGAYEAMRDDALRAGRNYAEPRSEKAKRVAEVLAKYGADPRLSFDIVENSTQGNQLAYAIQENIVAHAVRAAGYDAVVGYSKGKAGANISEVFDVREQTFPARGMDSDIHEAFQQAARPAVTRGTDPDTGLPEISTPELHIGFAQPTERLEFIPTDDSQQMLQLIIHGRDGQYLGVADVLFEGDTPRALYDIGITERGQGTGARVVEALLESAGGTLEISNIVEAARPFWESVGIPQQNLEQGAAYDATLTTEAFTASRAGARLSATRGMGSAGAQAGAGTDAGTTGTNQGELNQPAYHGTPYRGIEKFSTDKIGTGEGAQAYGWGLYFASKREIAEHYRRALSRGVPTVRVNGRTVSGTVFNSIANRLNDSLDAITLDDVRAEIEQRISAKSASADLTDKAAVKELRAALKKLNAAKSFEVLQGDNPGQLYEVDIPEDSEMLLWDKPLSEQPAKVRDAIAGMLEKYVQPTIDIYVTRNGERMDPSDRAFSHAQKIISEGFDAYIARLDSRAQDLKEKRGGNDPLARAAAASLALAESLRGDTFAQANGEIGRTDGDTSGNDLYKALERALGSDRAASEALAAVGVKGIKYLDGTSRGAGDGTFNYVVFSGDDVAILDQFYQQARGTFSPSQLLITLSEQSDLSTFLHESGHFFLEVMADLSSQPNAPAGVVEDMNKLLDWFGIKGDEQVGGADSGVPLTQGGVTQEVEDAIDAITGGDLEDDQVFSRPMPESDDDTLGYVAKIGASPVGTGGVHLSVRGGEVKEAGPHEFFFHDNNDEPVGFARLTKNTTQASINMIAFSEGARGNGYGKAFYKYLLDDLGLEIKSDKEITAGTAAMYRSLAKEYPVSVDADGRVVVSPKTATLAQGGNLPADNTQPAGRTPLEVWNAMTLDQKRPHHERLAESFEQYLMEGRAPSIELQPVFRRFRSWMLRVYKSLTNFLRGRPTGAQGMPGTLGQALQSDAFKRWFGDSKVVDANGEPLVVYRGEGSGENFEVFNRNEVRENAFFFTDDTDIAGTYSRQGTPGPRAFYLKVDKLFDPNSKAGEKFIREWAKSWDEWIDRQSGEDVDPVDLVLSGRLFDYEGDWSSERWRDLQSSIEAAGYDGAKLPDWDNTKGTFTAYIVFNPNQIKSATGNSGAFDPNNPSILAQTGNAPGELNDEIRKVFDRMLATDEQIAAAEQAAGMMPDFEATNEAIEQLQSRRLRDMKWMVNARAKAIKALQKQAAELRKGVEAEVLAEVEAMPEFRAKAALDALRKENKRAPNDAELATVADSFGYPDVDSMLQAIDSAGKKADMVEGMTDQRMLERHGDLIDQRAIEEAANEAVHNEARARVLATELKAQADALNPRVQTGTASNGRATTVNGLVQAAKLFAQNLTARRKVKDLKAAAAQHRAAEARAARRWQQATSKGNTQEAVDAKRDQLLNNYTAKAMQEAQAEVKKILEFFARVTKGSNEKTVQRGRDPDVVNAARAILAAHGVAPQLEKSANEYLAAVQTNDPAMYAALEPSVTAALQTAMPVGEMSLEELRGLSDEIGAMWHLAKRSRQMEVDGNLMDLEDAADELQARMQAIGVPTSIPGERSAITPGEAARSKLQFAVALLRRVEQWAEAKDGKFGGPFLRLVFQPVKAAADRYRTDRVAYRKQFTALVEAIAPSMREGTIDAPELGYTFGKGHNGIGMAELLHAILHTGNESNMRKLLLGRNWATENADGTLDTGRWDTFIQRMTDTGVLTKAHYDFAQGVWDLLDSMKPLAQKTHRDVFGRYFDEVTARAFTTPFGEYRGGYVPAQADPRIVTDAALRKLAEAENENMAFAFPATGKGFTKSRVEYNRPLMLDLRTLAQHIDKVLLFSHMEPAVRDVNRLLSRKGVSYSLSRIDPAAYEGMLIPWLNRAARQVVETPIVGDGGVSRALSIARQRAGMALMFGNISNTIQQITGLSTAAIKVRPANLMRATAAYIASPRKTAQRVADASPYMRDRMENEVAALNNTMQDILLDPSLYERAQAWTSKHAYFLQTALDNVLSPIVWTGAYNQAVAEGMADADALKYADGVVRQTQGTTLPEDVSRIETGPAYARLFTQFIGYFNMVANTNGTALKQVADEMGMRKGAGRALGIVFLGLLIPAWTAEAIALAFRGGPDDEDKDGYLDDWLASVIGMGTLKTLLAGVPFVGQFGMAAANRFNNQPMDDRVSLSPAVSLLESAVGAPQSVYKALADDGSKARAVKDVATAVSIATGLPVYAAARPLSYLAGVADNKIEPTSPADAVRGVVTGTPSPESRQR